MRTTGLLHTRVFSCRAFVRAPNGIRTRAAALKGRCPRPLDDGGQPPLLTAEEGQPPEYSGGRVGPRRSDARRAEDIAQPHVCSDVTLEHVPRTAAEQHPPGRRAIDADHTPGPIQERDRDREPHAHRMDGPAALEEQTFARSKVALSKPVHPFTALRGHVDVPRAGAWTGQDHPSHRPSHSATLTTIDDILVGLAGFEPATRGLKAPCSYQAELQAPWGF